jgi:hypothetical protein
MISGGRVMTAAADGLMSRKSLERRLDVFIMILALTYSQQQSLEVMIGGP